MKSSTLALVCLVMLAVPSRAQQDDVSMKIDVVAWGDEIKGLSVKPGSSKGTITALGFRYSKPVAYSGPVIMSIYQTGSAPAPAAPAVDFPAAGRIVPRNPFASESKNDPAPKPAPKQGLALELERRRQKDPSLVALAVLPGGACRRATVLLAAAEAGTFTAYVIDDDPSKLPVGHVRIHNLCPVPIAMRCNGQPVKQLNNRDAIIVPAIKDHLIYELAYQLGDEWKVQENNVIPVHPDEQAQMIILKSDHSYFLASDGSRSGFLQLLTLRRSPDSR
ncbi:MAG: hypothetical protein NTW21_04465 [Verrucomicrobia bacterium]|nr:hypothetical protein [Verrucomicrobiota bacterium]